MPDYQEYFCTRTIVPSYVLFQIGKVALNRAETEDRFKTLNLITSQLMCAFSLEAALNVIGDKVFKERPVLWDQVEKSRFKDKIKLLAEDLRIIIDWGAEPFQHFKEIKIFRDNLAHAKPVSLHTQINPSTQLDEDNYPLIDEIPELKTEWEKRVCIENAKKWRIAVYDMVEILSTAANTINPLFCGDFIESRGTFKTS